jgi:hypothetical protein
VWSTRQLVQAACTPIKTAAQVSPAITPGVRLMRAADFSSIRFEVISAVRPFFGMTKVLSDQL